jgi:glycerol kinase
MLDAGEGKSKTMTGDYVIGVDQGTSSTKALLIDRDGTVLAEAGRPIEVAHPKAGWVEQDPRAMVHNTVACVRELLEKSNVDARRVATLGLDNHTETLVLWHKETGDPVHPAIVWQCRRSASESESLDTEANRSLIRVRTGLDLDPTFTATKLLWVCRNRPDIAEGLRDGSILFGTVDCWLVWQLTGGRSYATEASNASRTMLFRIDQLVWDPDLFDLFGLEVGALPEVCPSTGPFGTCEANRFGVEIPITGVLGDQQAALFGHGCFKEGEFKSTYGTGAFVWMNAGHDYRPVEGAGYLQTVAWSLDRPTYAFEGFVMYAGAVLDWLANNLGLAESAGDIAAKAEAAGTSAGVALVPAFQGLASPWWAPKARAAVLGMSSSTRAEEVCHAALEAVCFQVRRVLDDMASADVRPSGTVRADGGLTRSAYLLQMQADILGLPVLRAEMANVTPYGVGLLAGLGAGLWQDTSALASLTGSGQVYRARPQASEGWSRRYDAWCRAVDGVLSWSLDGIGA